MVKINSFIKQVFPNAIRNLELNKGTIFKKILPLLFGASVLIAGVSTLIYRKFIKKNNVTPPTKSINTVKGKSLSKSEIEHVIPLEKGKTENIPQKRKDEESVSSSIVSISEDKYDVEDKNIISLSAEDYNQFERFIKRNKIPLEKRTHITKYKDKFYLESKDVCIAYAKFLIKTSDNHPLKDVHIDDIIFVCNYIPGNNIQAILDTIRPSMYKIDDLDNEIICKYIKKELPKDISPCSESDSKLIEETYFLDIRVLTNCIIESLGKEPSEKSAIVMDIEKDDKINEIIIFNSPSAIGNKACDNLKERDPNIKIKFYGPINFDKRIIAMNKSSYSQVRGEMNRILKTQI